MAPSEKRPWTCLPLDSDLSLSWEQWGGRRAGSWQRWTWGGGGGSLDWCAAGSMAGKEGLGGTQAEG